MGINVCISDVSYCVSSGVLNREGWLGAEVQYNTCLHSIDMMADGGLLDVMNIEMMYICSEGVEGGGERVGERVEVGNGRR